MDNNTGIQNNEGYSLADFPFSKADILSIIEFMYETDVPESITNTKVAQILEYLYLKAEDVSNNLQTISDSASSAKTTAESAQSTANAAKNKAHTATETANAALGMAEENSFKVYKPKNNLASNANNLIEPGIYLEVTVNTPANKPALILAVRARSTSAQTSDRVVQFGFVDEELHVRNGMANVDGTTWQFTEWLSLRGGGEETKVKRVILIDDSEADPFPEQRFFEIDRHPFEKGSDDLQDLLDNGSWTGDIQFKSHSVDFTQRVSFLVKRDGSGISIAYADLPCVVDSVFCIVQVILRDFRDDSFHSAVVRFSHIEDYLEIKDLLSVRNGLEFDDETEELSVDAGRGLGFDSIGRLQVSPGDGLKLSGDDVAVKTGEGLQIDTTGAVKVKSGFGLKTDENSGSVVVNTGNGLGVGLDGKLNVNFKEAKDYTDQKIAGLVGEGVDEALDTLREIGDAIKDGSDVHTALTASIGSCNTRVTNCEESICELTERIASAESVPEALVLSPVNVGIGSGAYAEYYGNQTMTDRTAFIGNAPEEFWEIPPNMIIRNEGPQSHKHKFAKLMEWMELVASGKRIPLVIQSADGPSRTLYPEDVNNSGTQVEFEPFYDEDCETWVKSYISRSGELYEDGDETDDTRMFELDFVPDSPEVSTLIQVNGEDIQFTCCEYGEYDSGNALDWRDVPFNFDADLTWDVITILKNAGELVFSNLESQGGRKKMNPLGDTFRVRMCAKMENGDDFELLSEPVLARNGKVVRLNLSVPKTPDPSGRMHVCGIWELIGESMTPGSSLYQGLISSINSKASQTSLNSTNTRMTQCETKLTNCQNTITNELRPGITKILRINPLAVKGAAYEYAKGKGLQEDRYFCTDAEYLDNHPNDPSYFAYVPPSMLFDGKTGGTFGYDRQVKNAVEAMHIEILTFLIDNVVTGSTTLTLKGGGLNFVIEIENTSGDIVRLRPCRLDKEAGAIDFEEIPDPLNGTFVRARMEISLGNSLSATLIFTPRSVSVVPLLPTLVNVGTDHDYSLSDSIPSYALENISPVLSDMIINAEELVYRSLVNEKCYGVESTVVRARVVSKRVDSGCDFFVGTEPLWGLDSTKKIMVNYNTARDSTELDIDAVPI